MIKSVSLQVKGIHRCWRGICLKRPLSWRKAFYGRQEILVLRHWAKLFGGKPQKRDVSKNTRNKAKRLQGSYARPSHYRLWFGLWLPWQRWGSSSMKRGIVLWDGRDRPLRRKGSSSETEGIVLKHPRIKAKRRQGIYAGRRKDRSPILFSPDCQRPLKKEICTAGLKAAMPTGNFLFFPHMTSSLLL